MAADVWALGGTMYMLKMGRPPFLAKKIMDLCYKIIHEDVAWPSPSSSSSSSSSSGAAASIQGGIGSSGPLDPGVQRILDGMLQKEPKARLTLPQVGMAIYDNYCVCSKGSSGVVHARSTNSMNRC